MTPRHTCHADDCAKGVPASMLMCGQHWRMVPRSVQREVWAAYEDGQEIRKDPSAEYLIIQEVAVCAVAVKEGRISAEEAEARVRERADLADYIAAWLPIMCGPS